MATVKISSKFQVTIPRSIRERLRLSPGQKLHFIVYEDHIELIPQEPAQRLRGFLRAIDTEVPRDRDRA